VNDISDIAMEQIEQVEEPEETNTNSGKDKLKQQYEELKVYWSKRNWCHIFERFDKYAGGTALSLTAWSKLLEWMWSALSKEHMSELHGVSQRLRSSRRRIPSSVRYNEKGIERSESQEELIRAYHAVIRSETSEDLNTITQRLALVALYTEHISYSEEFRGNGKSRQQRQQDVNRTLHKIFNRELDTRVSIQMIKNHVKEGRHWYEMLNMQETRHFGYGLLLLLPARGYKNICRTTSEPVWLFLLQQIPNMSQRIIDLAKALQPVGKAIMSQGSGSVVVPLLGYEIRTPVNLHDISTNDFNDCLIRYTDLPIANVFKIIQQCGRPRTTDEMLELLQAVRESSNSNEITPLAQGRDSSCQLERDQGRSQESVEEAEQEITVSHSDTHSHITIIEDQVLAATGIYITMETEAILGQVSMEKLGKPIIHDNVDCSKETD
jgi:hypothetical protein